MSVSVVKFVGNLVAVAPTGFQPRFDLTGAYQPTVGNIVLFAAPLTNDPGNLDAPAGYTKIVITSPGIAQVFNVFWKIWTSLDSTTAMIRPACTSPYVAYEITGFDPLNPTDTCGFGDSQPPPTIQIFDDAGTGAAGSLALMIVFTIGIPFPTSGNYADIPPSTFDSGLSFDGYASQARNYPTLPGGTVISASMVVSSPSSFTPTAFGVPGPTDGSVEYHAITPIFNPGAGPPPVVARTSSNQRRAATFPLRAAVSRV